MGMENGLIVCIFPLTQSTRYFLGVQTSLMARYCCHKDIYFQLVFHLHFLDSHATTHRLFSCNHWMIFNTSCWNYSHKTRYSYRRKQYYTHISFSRSDSSRIKCRILYRWYCSEQVCCQETCSHLVSLPYLRMTVLSAYKFLLRKTVAQTDVDPNPGLYSYVICSSDHSFFYTGLCSLTNNANSDRVDRRNIQGKGGRENTLRFDAWVIPW